MKRCPECGSWEAQCSSETPVQGCGCARCAQASIKRLKDVLKEARQKLKDWHNESLEQFGGGGMCEYDFCRACGEPEYRDHKPGCEYVELIDKIETVLSGA